MQHIQVEMVDSWRGFVPVYRGDGIEDDWSNWKYSAEKERTKGTKLTVVNATVMPIP